MEIDNNPIDLSAGSKEFEASTLAPPVVPVLPEVSNWDTTITLKKSVTTEMVRLARKFMVKALSNPLSAKEIEEYIEAVRKAAYTEGYMKAKMEEALKTREMSPQGTVAVPEKAPEPVVNDKRPYVSRVSALTTRKLALDYLQSVAPREVSPTEIIKNTQASTGIKMSFGTLNRAMEELVNSGAVEQTEPSRWKFKPFGSPGNITPMKKFPA